MGKNKEPVYLLELNMDFTSMYITRTYNPPQAAGNEADRASFIQNRVLERKPPKDFLFSFFKKSDGFGM